MAGSKLTPEDDALWAAIKKTVRPLERKPAPPDDERHDERHDGRPGGQARKRRTFDGASDIPQSQKPVARRPKSALTPPVSPPPASKPPPMPPAQAPAHGPALDPKSRRRLSRGREDVDGRLDLHGLDQVAAFHALVGFLRGAQADGKRLVLVITGKGQSQYGQSGVLRSAVPAISI